jgi:hypothetical protein
MAIGLKGIWEVKRKIEKVEASEGNIMHNNLTANASHVQYCAGNDLTFIGTGVDPDEKRVMQLVKDPVGDYNVWFGHNHAERYSFPNEHGTSGQILQLSIGDPGAALNWVDPAASNISDTDLTQTATREYYFNDFTLTFKNSLIGSNPVLSLNGLGISLGSTGEEGTGWDLNLTRAGIAGKCLTSVGTETITTWAYPWNVSEVPGTGNMAIGVGTFTGYGEGTGEDNIVIGDGSGLAISAGDDNIIVGADSGVSINGGDGNIIIGTGSGANTVASDKNIIIGNSSQQSFDDGSTIMIGHQDSGTGANQLRFGSSLSPAGLVTTETLTSDTTVQIFINGTAYKFLVKA